MVRLKGTHYYIWRYRAVLVLMLLLLVIISARAFHLHVLEGEFLRGEGNMRFLRYESLSANRGMVTDRHGRPLAISTPVSSLWVNPSLIMSDAESLRAFRGEVDFIASHLKMSPKKILARIEKHSNKQFLYLKRHLPPEQIKPIMQQRIDGVGAINEFKRYYPASEVTSHLVGFTNIDDEGQEGMELAYERHLRGVPGKRRVIKDRKGRVVQDLGVVESPQAGNALQLTIDLRMQYYAHKVLKEAVKKRSAESASLVALDVVTGEVLALVNEPSYNPNDRRSIDPAALRNRAMTDAVEPGSTVKPFTVAAAMEANLVSPYTPIDTSPGYMPVGRKLVKDFRNYGMIDVTTVLTKSSNVGAAKLALQLPYQESLAGILARVGFGEELGTSFPGESLGHLPARTRWRPLEIATLSYGYGLSVNLVQLARSYAVLANGGFKVPISLVKPTVEQLQHLPKQSVMDAQITDQMIGMLETVVSKEGTASRAKVDGYRVAGKTGTVFKVGKKGYDENRYRALFVGFAPATNPELVVAIVVEDPKGDERGGGEVAAPIFGQTMTGLLRFKDAMPDAPQARTAMN